MRKAILYYDIQVCVDRCPYSEDAMSRAVVDRVTGIQDGRLPRGYTQHRPVLLHTSVPFQHCRPLQDGGTEKHSPCAACTWSPVFVKLVEVANLYFFKNRNCQEAYKRTI